MDNKLFLDYEGLQSFSDKSDTILNKKTTLNNEALGENTFASDIGINRLVGLNEGALIDRYVDEEGIAHSHIKCNSSLTTAETDKLLSLADYKMAVNSCTQGFLERPDLPMIPIQGYQGKIEDFKILSVDTLDNTMTYYNTPALEGMNIPGMVEGATICRCPIINNKAKCYVTFPDGSESSISIAGSPVMTTYGMLIGFYFLHGMSFNSNSEGIAGPDVINTDQPYVAGLDENGNGWACIFMSQYICNDKMTPAIGKAQGGKEYQEFFAEKEEPSVGDAAWQYFKIDDSRYIPYTEGESDAPVFSVQATPTIVANKTYCEDYDLYLAQRDPLNPESDAINFLKGTGLVQNNFYYLTLDAAEEEVVVGTTSVDDLWTLDSNTGDYLQASGIAQADTTYYSIIPNEVTITPSVDNLYFQDNTGIVYTGAEGVAQEDVVYYDIQAEAVTVTPEETDVSNYYVFEEITIPGEPPAPDTTIVTYTLAGGTAISGVSYYNLTINTVSVVVGETNVDNYFTTDTSSSNFVKATKDITPGVTLYAITATQITGEEDEEEIDFDSLYMCALERCAIDEQVQEGVDYYVAEGRPVAEITPGETSVNGYFEYNANKVILETTPFEDPSNATPSILAVIDNNKYLKAYKAYDGYVLTYEDAINSINKCLYCSNADSLNAAAVCGFVADNVSAEAYQEGEIQGWLLDELDIYNKANLEQLSKITQSSLLANALVNTDEIMLNVVTSLESANGGSSADTSSYLDLNEGTSWDLLPNVKYELITGDHTTCSLHIHSTEGDGKYYVKGDIKVPNYQPWSDSPNGFRLEISLIGNPVNWVFEGDVASDSSRSSFEMGEGQYVILNNYTLYIGAYQHFEISLEAGGEAKIVCTDITPDQVLCTIKSSTLCLGENFPNIEGVKEASVSLKGMVMGASSNLEDKILVEIGGSQQYVPLTNDEMTASSWQESVTQAAVFGNYIYKIPFMKDASLNELPGDYTYREILVPFYNPNFNYIGQKSLDDFNVNLNLNYNGEPFRFNMLETGNNIVTPDGSSQFVDILDYNQFNVDSPYTNPLLVMEALNSNTSSSPITYLCFNYQMFSDSASANEAILNKVQAIATAEGVSSGSISLIVLSADNSNVVDIYTSEVGSDKDYYIYVQYSDGTHAEIWHASSVDRGATFTYTHNENLAYNNGKLLYSTDSSALVTANSNLQSNPYLWNGTLVSVSKSDPTQDICKLTYPRLVTQEEYVNNPVNVYETAYALKYYLPMKPTTQTTSWSTVAYRHVEIVDASNQSYDPAAYIRVLVEGSTVADTSVNNNGTVTASVTGNCEGDIIIQPMYYDGSNFIDGTYANNDWDFNILSADKALNSISRAASDRIQFVFNNTTSVNTTIEIINASDPSIRFTVELQA